MNFKDVKIGDILLDNDGTHNFVAVVSMVGPRGIFAIGMFDSLGVDRPGSQHAILKNSIMLKRMARIV